MEISAIGVPASGWWPACRPARCVEPIAPSSPWALPEPPLPFDRYLEELNRIAARVDSEARLPRYAHPGGSLATGRLVDVIA
ncbi:MAG: hypothetical protein IT436_13730 [Phycisphaerales bacterium]|nr:hypothetical protein [Phycisphaerales bacterium]